MPSTTCPGCGRNTNVRLDGRFVKHVSHYTRARCVGSETDAAIPFAEAAVRTAEHRAKIRREVVSNRVAARERVIADYDATTESARGLADYCDSEVAKARAALAALRGAT